MSASITKCMSYILDRILERTNIGSAPIRYKWDESDVLAYYDPPEKKLVRTLSRLDFRFNLGFALGTAEFILYRYSGMTLKRMPWEYCQAAWATLINWRYLRYEEVDDDEWAGPVLGVLNCVITLVVDTVTCVNQEQKPEFPAASLCRLAAYVLDKPEEYESWVVNTVKAGKDIRRRNLDDPVGPPLAPAFFENSDARDEPNAEITRFLGRIAQLRNPWLLGPRELREVDFDGEPYLWNPAIDQMREEHILGALPSE